jgi:hypothetical protein
MRKHSHRMERGWNMGSWKQKEIVRKNVQEKRKVRYKRRREIRNINTVWKKENKQ